MVETVKLVIFRISVTLAIFGCLMFVWHCLLNPLKHYLKKHNLWDKYESLWNVLVFIGFIVGLVLAALLLQLLVREMEGL